VLVTADWIVPVSSAPIRGGAVAIIGQRILDVGTLQEVRTRNPKLPVHEFPGCVVAPGLVNAHTHLSLSALGGVLPHGAFVPWIRSMGTVVQSLSPDDFGDAAAFGALQCLASGVTAVGDIAYGPEAPAAAVDMGLGGAFFWEILGMSGLELAEALAESEFPEFGAGCGPRMTCGLSPHTPYTSGPSLLQQMHDEAERRGAPYAIHLAETMDEVRLMANGSGELADVAGRLAFGFRPPGRGPVAYLEQLGVLKDTTAIHCVNVGGADIRLLARAARGVVLCPRSNSALGNGRPPAEAILASGVAVGLGTDSIASNDDLDLFAEGRALLAIATTLTPQRLLEIMTCEGARAIGIGDRFGAIEPGKQADLAVVRVDARDRPVDALVREGSVAAIEAVVSAGAWRIIDGRPSFASDRVVRAAEAVRERARAALGGGAA
jgi:cytosine/adenosine deaminase-related metal-dependent hydrolase